MLPRRAITAWPSATPANGDTAYHRHVRGSRSWTTTSPTYARLDPRQYKRLGLRHGPRPPRLPPPVGEWNFEEVNGQGLNAQGGAERHPHPRRRLEQGDGDHGKAPTPGKDRTEGHFGFAVTTTRWRSATSRSSGWIRTGDDTVLSKAPTLTGLVLALGCVLAVETKARAAATAGRPTIVFILADDMGYGDPQCYTRTRRSPPPT